MKHTCDECTNIFEYPLNPFRGGWYCDECLTVVMREFDNLTPKTMKKHTEEEINKIIQEEKLDTNKISDGYHTFGELYDHRIALFIALCNRIPLNSWKAVKHFDGSEWEGWFIAGIGKTPGKQITYHLPLEKWDLLKSLEFEKAPCEWDGHTSSDVIKRLEHL